MPQNAAFKIASHFLLKNYTTMFEFSQFFALVTDIPNFQLLS